MRTVSIFKNNANQAVRIPKDMQFDGVTVLGFCHGTLQPSMRQPAFGLSWQVSEHPSATTVRQLPATLWPQARSWLRISYGNFSACPTFMFKIGRSPTWRQADSASAL
jgi:virulence-associated protein VagC